MALPGARYYSGRHPSDRHSKFRSHEGRGRNGRVGVPAPIPHMRYAYDDDFRKHPFIHSFFIDIPLGRTSNSLKEKSKPNPNPLSNPILSSITDRLLIDSKYTRTNTRRTRICPARFQWSSWTAGYMCVYALERRGCPFFLSFVPSIILLFLFFLSLLLFLVLSRHFPFSLSVHPV